MPRYPDGVGEEGGAGVTARTKDGMFVACLKVISEQLRFAIGVTSALNSCSAFTFFMH